MDDTELLSDLRSRLVELVIQQQEIFSNWIKFAITVQGGVAAGMGFVLSDPNNKYRILGFIIPFFGVLTAVLFAKILWRHAQWSVWYINSCNSLTAASKISPTQPREIANQKPGPVARWTVRFLVLVAIAWIGLFLVAVWPKI
jgi:hypothetical protein